MNKVTDMGLYALACAGVGPGLEHLEILRESPDFHCASFCFSLVVFISPLSALIMLLISGFLQLIAGWVIFKGKGSAPGISVVFGVSARRC